MARKIELNLPPADDLFSTQDERDNLISEKVQDIPLDCIDTFPNHPFLVKNDEEMQAMVESIKSAGVQTPAVVRPKPDGRHELISGHRRKLACELAGMETMPCIIREMGDDEAVISMVDSNLQREVILPSEKAKSYKMKLDAMKKQAGRPSKNNPAPVVQNFGGKSSREQLAVNSPDSHEQIRRYIRLTELIPSLLQMVDEKKLALRPAVEISHLAHEQQQLLTDAIEYEDRAPSYAESVVIRKLGDEQKLDYDAIVSIMQESRTVQEKHFKIPQDRISKFFAAETSAEEIEKTIIKALELWHHKRAGERQKAK